MLNLYRMQGIDRCSSAVAYFSVTAAATDAGGAVKKI